MGDTSFFCPVALKEHDVLWPGDPETGAKYREKVYYISNNDYREKFLDNPVKYLPTHQPFTVRNQYSVVNSDKNLIWYRLFFLATSSTLVHLGTERVWEKFTWTTISKNLGNFSYSI